MACERTNEPTPGAEDLRLTWTLKHNALPDEPGAAQFVITNVSEAAFPASGWAIYYSQQGGGVRANSLPEGMTAPVDSGFSSQDRMNWTSSSIGRSVFLARLNVV